MAHSIFQDTPDLKVLDDNLDFEKVAVLRKQGRWSDFREAEHYLEAIRNLLDHPDVRHALDTEAFRQQHSSSKATDGPMSFLIDELEQIYDEIQDRVARIRDEGIHQRTANPFGRLSKRTISKYSTRSVLEIREYRIQYPLWKKAVEGR